MKLKKWFLPMLVLVLVLVLVLTMTAGVSAEAGDSAGRIPHITDTYGLLTEGETAALESRAAAISSRYGCSVYVYVVRDYSLYASNTFQFAIDSYEAYNLGWGSEKAGIMLMLSMAERNYEILMNASVADRAFTEYGLDRMEDRFLEYFRENDFSGGFREFLDTCDEYLLAAENGKPVDKGFSMLFFLPGVIAAVVAGLVVYLPMKSTGMKHGASDYVEPGSLNMKAQADVFVNRTVTRRPRQTESSSHSSSHHSGSYSGRSGKF